jgi:hydroxymethylpyrimidine/phosphomethylpyrimidine kinase
MGASPFPSGAPAGGPRLPRLLVVGGHDPSGAGLAADRDALAGLPLAASFVATALTRQDERGLVALGAREPEGWLDEARAHADAGVDALKLGLLPGPEHAAAAGRLVDALPSGTPVVLDPVIAPSRGGRFLERAGVRALVRDLGPRYAIVTPNLPELAELAELDAVPLALEARVDAARRLLGSGFGAVLAKGGHGEEDPAIDLVVTSEQVVRLAHARLAGRSIRGSGCRFATRLAAGLALGRTLPEAAREAGELVLARLAAIPA